MLSPLEDEMRLLDQCANRSYTEGEKKHLAMMDFALNEMTYEELAAKVNI